MKMLIDIPHTHGQGSRRLGYFLDENHNNNNKRRRNSLPWNDVFIIAVWEWLQEVLKSGWRDVV